MNIHSSRLKAFIRRSISPFRFADTSSSTALHFRIGDASGSRPHASLRTSSENSPALLGLLQSVNSIAAGIADSDLDVLAGSLGAS